MRRLVCATWHLTGGPALSEIGLTAAKRSFIFIEKIYKKSGGFLRRAINVVAICCLSFKCGGFLQCTPEDVVARDKKLSP